MRKIMMTFLMIFFLLPLTAAEKSFDKDVIKTGAGDLEITFIGHGSLIFTFNGMVVYVDPFSRVADYSQMPKADLVLITHQHGDHMDAEAVGHIKEEKTKIILTKKCSETIKDGIVMTNGDVKEIKLKKTLKIEAVPAYNIVHKRGSGQPFHPKGEGNGYIITFGDKRVYVAGDTENIPEMKKLENIAIAFLPANLPYTMTAEMVVDAVTAFKPAVLYPYHFHFGTSQVPKLEALLKDKKDIDLRIRSPK
jgi:L-ascorbate metabolism protein UlaG (beta-lactamase superfamily)